MVDGWLELVISDSATALRVLSSALMIRDNWDNLLQAKLNQSGLRSTAGLQHAGPAPSHRELQKISEELVRFLMYTEVMYWC